MLLLGVNMITAKDLYTRLQHVKIGGTTCVYSMEKCESYIPTIQRIQELKKEKNAIILAHSYVSPEVLYSVSDFFGDSYELSKKAKATDADIVVFAAVKFMAETAKLLNPEKEVLVPSQFNGCSLADSITADDVRRMRETYPDHTFVCYINTTADVKAECDVCVTSSNVYDIVETIDNEKIYFLPDKLMGENVIEEMKQRGVRKTIQLWDGNCYVHKAFDPDMIDGIRMSYDDISVLSHPECESEVIAKSDYVGSTSQMVNYVKDSDKKRFFLLTECGLTTRLQSEVSDKEFVGTCTMCKYMKSNSLQGILNVLEQPKPEDVIQLDPTVSEKALECIDAMFDYTDRIKCK